MIQYLRRELHGLRLTDRGATVVSLVFWVLVLAALVSAGTSDYAMMERGLL